MKNEEYKKLSIAEFTKAAGRYESNHAGIYEMCKKDYPDILEELEKEPFRDLLDAGCGPAPMISLLAEKYPDRHYTGLDLTPAMIEQAKKKNISNGMDLFDSRHHFSFVKAGYQLVSRLQAGSTLHRLPVFQSDAIPSFQQLLRRSVRNAVL